ncbi:formin-2-like isoform X2 [Amphibalanus amphitrite]|uniref:formin-2-like isoform X2 n=1 Tax=Amphibalanus amphitrite TaxID=1232801 RepID=UPI001C925E6A|nr:formin-2-like isoform X2 [Amphibalanus amphitrite]
MSGTAMAQEGTKHVYHSIALEPAGAVTVPDGSRCCSGGRKVLTLLLASALLWVIVLDIMLVVYRSHHIGGSSINVPSETPLAGRLLILGAPAAPPTNVSLPTQSLEALPSLNATEAGSDRRQSAGTPGESVGAPGQSAGAPGESAGAPGESAVSSREPAVPSKPGRSADPPPPAIGGLEGWLSRLRHRSDRALMTSLDHRPRWPPRAPPLPAPNAERRQDGPPPPPLPAGGPPPLPAGGPPPLPAGGPPPPSAGRPGVRGRPPLPETGLLLRFFSAVMDAPWNLTSGGGPSRLPPPLPGRFMGGPPGRFMGGPPGRFMGGPPGRFMEPPFRPNRIPVIHMDDDQDSEDTILDIDITE